MGPVVVVVVLPFLEFLVEQAGVVLDDTVEQPVELFGVDAVGALDFPVEPRRRRADVDVADALSRACQWNADWNSAPLSVWIYSTWNGSRDST